MNNKGFTLIELLVSIVILGLILAISVSSINGISNSIKQSERKNLIARIETAGSKYAFDTGKTAVFVRDLIKDGYIDSENDTVLDPVDNKSLKCFVVKMEKQGDYYNATFVEDSSYGYSNGNCNDTKLNQANNNITIEIYKNGIRTYDLSKRLTGTIKLKAISNSIKIDCARNYCRWVISTGKTASSDEIEFTPSSAYSEITGTFTTTVNGTSYSSSVTIKT